MTDTFAASQRRTALARRTKRLCERCGKTVFSNLGAFKSHLLWCNPANAVARFWAKVDKRGAKECWEWKGQLRWDGYGRFVIMRKPVWTHRFSWELHNGRKIPAGGHILHSCNNPACVNPKHLRVGTHKENMAEAQRTGRWMESLAIAREVAHGK